MYWIIDVLVIALIGALLYRGIKLGFTNSFFTFVTAILWIALAAGIAGGVVFLALYMGWLQDFGYALTRAIGESIAGGVLIPNLLGFSLTLGDILAAVLLAIIIFIPAYIFSLWVGRQFERFVRFVRSKCKFAKVFGSILGAVVNLAIAAVLVLGFFWFIAAVDGSGLFTYTNEAVRAAPLSGLIYRNNPLYGILGNYGSLAETVRYFISGDFLLRK